MKKIDWMGYTLRRNEQFSYHHIDKREHGGLETRDNGAILTQNTSHPYLHIIEYKDIEIYVYINNILKCINTQGYMPTKNQLRAINSVLNTFERDHSNERNKKGKQIIKEEYYKRIIL